MTLPKKDYVSFFRNFDNIYISFSGGKDSGVLLNLCIDYIRKHNLKRQINCHVVLYFIIHMKYPNFSF